MKRILIIILSGIVLFSLVACTLNTTESDNSKQSHMTNDSPKPAVPTGPVFNTENVVNITLYAYYGEGKGSPVPEEHMQEILNWLDSFTIDKEVNDALLGTNTFCVEIEYSDGTVIKEGLDLMVINGVAYYIKGDTRPECFKEIIEKTSSN